MTATSTLFEPFARSVREQLFVPGDAHAQCVGAEIELIPVFDGSGEVVPLHASAGNQRPSTLDFLRHFGRERGWREQRSSKGAPYFLLPGRWTLTFEPGGQIELGSPPCTTASTLIAGVREQLVPMITAAAEQGIMLLSAGIDPRNDVSSVPLQLDADRYRRMDAFFGRIGPSGARMMRQTAATQLNLDAGADPAARWRLLCDLAPYLTAIFANSPRYAGADSGYRSFRAHCWRTLDASRTGVPADDLPACAAYTRFALDALDMMRLDSSDDYRSFGSWATDGAWTKASWENYLTTLFPEVRPRGHLELRSMDALAPEWLAAPVVVVCGLVYDRESSTLAREMLGPADASLLQLAAERALRDPSVASVAAELYACGLEGALRLGAQYLAPHDIEVAREFYERFTRRGRSPADDWSL